MKTSSKPKQKFCSKLCATFLFAALLAFAPPAQSDESNGAMKSGMAAFNAGNYSDAAGHFGLALTTEFNNSVLHYYLGNCFVHMKQREAAVREFRIAYALDPEKDVGKYAKQALAGLNADSPGGLPGAAAGPNVSAKDADAMAKNAVNKLMDLKKTPPPGGKPLIEISRGGRLIEQTPPPTPPLKPGQTPSQAPPVQPMPPMYGNARWEGLRRLYEANHASSQSAFELQRAAENLHELMIKQAKPGEHHVDPTGTNLYIRNYKTEGGVPDGGTSASKPPQSK